MILLADTESAAVPLQWAAWFPPDLLMAAIAGAFVAALWWFKSKMERAALPQNPSTAQAVWFTAVSIVAISIPTAVFAGAAVIEWMKISPTSSYRPLLSFALALFGVPLIDIAMRLGPTGVAKLIPGLNIPAAVDKGRGVDAIQPLPEEPRIK